MITLTCRLLCASRLSYEIAEDGKPVPLLEPYSAAAGFSPAPMGFCEGVNEINSCFVGTNDDGIVLAFRGTMPLDSPNHQKTFEDWLQDTDALLESHDPPIGGLVHAGFWEALDTLWTRLLPEVRRQLAAKPGAPLYVTGHSKGGAMANLAAARLVLAGISCTVCTFAAAHPGNADFAKFYETLFDPTRAQANPPLPFIASSTRYEYADDIVPHLPPGLALRHAMTAVGAFSKYVAQLDTLKPNLNKIDYAPVGALRFIDWDGNIVGSSPTLPISRALHLAELIMTCQFNQIVHDHSIDCESGYATAICPTGVCS